MNKRKIKKLFEGIDEMPMPSIEKVLPREAVDKATAYGVENRNAFPKLAAVSLAVVALVVATALVIGSVAGGNEKQIDPDNSLVLNNDSENTSIPAVLENEISNSEASVEHTSTEESEAPRVELPIVSCGSYTSSVEDCVHYVPYGEVAIGTMTGGCLRDVDELQDGVLYAVYFSADYIGYSSSFAQTEYMNGIRRIQEEASAMIKEAEENAIAFIEKYARAENHPFLDSYHFRNFTYREICEDIYENPTDIWPGQDDPEFEAVSTAVRRLWNEYEEKRWEFERITRENSTAKMYEYLEGLGIKFYDKTVYIIDSEYDNGQVYRVAFLTKEEIAALKGGEDYGIKVVQVFEELAKMDNEPVYIRAWGVDD